jgi:hypothetical protein
MEDRRATPVLDVEIDVAVSIGADTNIPALVE